MNIIILTEQTNVAIKVSQQVNTEHTHENPIQKILHNYGIMADAGLVVIITIFLIKFGKKVEKKLPRLAPWLPLIISAVVTFFMSPQIHTGEHSIWHVLREWGAETLGCAAGCFIIYNVIYKKWSNILENLKKLTHKNE